MCHDQVVPIPIPTAVIVIAGVLAEMDAFKILATWACWGGLRNRGTLLVS